MVTIMVTMMEKPPDVTGDDMAEYPEHGTAAVATYTVVDPEGADITSWTLDGGDADDFMIDGGVLTFKESPDYEMATDADTDNTYSVTVRATDESNKVGMHEATVEVTNVDEPGTVTCRRCGLSPRPCVGRQRKWDTRGGRKTREIWGGVSSLDEVEYFR